MKHAVIEVKYLQSRIRIAHTGALLSGISVINEDMITTKMNTFTVYSWLSVCHMSQNGIHFNASTTYLIIIYKNILQLYA